MVAKDTTPIIVGAGQYVEREATATSLGKPGIYPILLES